MKWFLLLAILLAGCSKSETSGLNSPEADFTNYLDTSDDPLAKAKREGTFDVFAAPKTPEDLFVYQVNFLRTTTGESVHTRRSTYNDIVATATCELPADPKTGTAVIAIRFSKPVTNKEIHSLGFGCIDFDFVKTSNAWSIADLFVTALETGKPAVKTTDGKMFVATATANDASLSVSLVSKAD